MTIADELNKIIASKADIKLAISEKGVEVPDGTPFSHWCESILQINGSSETFEYYTDDPALTDVQNEMAELQRTKENVRKAVIACGVEFPEDVPFSEYGNKVREIETVDYGDWGILYYTEDGEDKEIQLTSAADQAYLCRSSSTSKISINGTIITSADVKGYALGASGLDPSNVDYFLNSSFPNLEFVKNTKQIKGQLGRSFAYNCKKLNCPLDLSNVTSVGNSFLSGCTIFDSPVSLPNVTSIGTTFMADCKAFNSPLDISSVETIGGNFFREYSYTIGAIKFNQPLSLEHLVSVGDDFLTYSSYNQPLNMPNVQTIGTQFLYQATSFNSELSLPKATRIGDRFMYDCLAFDHPLDLPELQTTGYQFLAGCKAFNSQLTIPKLTSVGYSFMASGLRGGAPQYNLPLETPQLTTIGNDFMLGNRAMSFPLSFPALSSVGTSFLCNMDNLTGPVNIGNATPPTDDRTLANNFNNVPQYTTGVTITGANAQAWIDALPNRSSGTLYRNLVLGGGSDLPDSIDISKPLDESTLEDIKKVVAAGKAEDYFKLGDELLVNYKEVLSYVIPFEIVGFEEVETDNGVKPALNLLAKYTSIYDKIWGSNGVKKYSGSTLRTYIIGPYQEGLDANFVNCLANTKVQTYSRDGFTDIVYDKLFVPSMLQLGVTDISYATAQQTAVEGPAFTAYKDAADSKRIKQAINATGTEQGYWTRSLYQDVSSAYSNITTSGAPNYDYYNVNLRVLAACNLVGD